MYQWAREQLVDPTTIAAVREMLELLPIDALPTMRRCPNITDAAPAQPALRSRKRDLLALARALKSGATIAIG